MFPLGDLGRQVPLPSVSGHWQNVYPYSHRTEVPPPPHLLFVSQEVVKSTPPPPLISQELLSAPRGYLLLNVEVHKLVKYLINCFISIPKEHIHTHFYGMCFCVANVDYAFLFVCFLVPNLN